MLLLTTSWCDQVRLLSLGCAPGESKEFCAEDSLPAHQRAGRQLPAETGAVGRWTLFFPTAPQNLIWIITRSRDLRYNGGVPTQDMHRDEWLNDGEEQM